MDLSFGFNMHQKKANQSYPIPQTSFLDVLINTETVGNHMKCLVSADDAERCQQPAHQGVFLLFTQNEAHHQLLSKFKTQQLQPRTTDCLI